MPLPLRIVHVTAYFAPAVRYGGPARSLLSLCRAQQQAGADLEVFTTTADGDGDLPAAPDGTSLDGVRVRYFPLSPPRRAFGARSMRVPLQASAASADVVHLHGLFNRTVWMGSAAARRAGTPVVVSPRGMLEAPALAHHPWLKRLAWAWRDEPVMRHAVCWHATSLREAEGLRRHGGTRVIHIPNAVDPVAASETLRLDARRSIGVPAVAPYVLFLGRLHPIKRLDLLAAAFREVAAAVPEVHLVIAGPDEGGHRAEVAPLFDAERSRVHWCGPVDGALKAGLLSGASTLVQCSDSESFGMSVAEALSAAVPVVVTRTCPWHAIETAGCGYWVDQTAAAIADGVIRLLRDPDGARRRGERGRAHAAREFSPTHIAGRWLELYAGLAERSQPERDAVDARHARLKPDATSM